MSEASEAPGVPVTATPVPCTAVVFTSRRPAGAGQDGYEQAAARMAELAAQQPGYLGLESARGEDGLGVSVSYWRDEASARAWKQVAEHLVAQQRGREGWYEWYAVRVATVTRQYAGPRRSSTPDH